MYADPPADMDLLSSQFLLITATPFGLTCPKSHQNAHLGEQKVKSSPPLVYWVDRLVLASVVMSEKLNVLDESILLRWE